LLLGAVAANPAAGLLIDCLAGSGIGSIAGAFHQADAEQNLANEVGGHLKPDSSAFAVIAWTKRPAKLLKELERFEGAVIETSLSIGNKTELRTIVQTACCAA
jgi:uncharacterized membrane protein